MSTTITTRVGRGAAAPADSPRVAIRVAASAAARTAGQPAWRSMVSDPAPT